MKTKTLIKTILGVGALVGLLYFGFQPAKKVYEWGHTQLGNRYVLDVANDKTYIKDLKTGQQEQIFDSLYVGNAEHRLRSLENSVNQDPGSNESLIERVYEYSWEKLSELNKKTGITEGYENPYNLKILARKTPKGIEGYVVNKATGDTLPIMKDNQVGDMKHRLKGLFSYLKQNLNLQ